MYKHVIFGVLWGVSSPMVFGLDIQECLSRMGSSERRMDLAELRACVETVRTHGARGDQNLWEGLHRIISSDGIHQRIRMEAIKLACEKADATTAPQILALGASWAAALDTSRKAPEEFARDESARVKSLLLSPLILDGIDTLMDNVADQQEIAELAKEVATDTWCSLQASNRCLEIIAEVSLPPHIRRRIILETMEVMKRSTVVPYPFLRSLDESAFPVLRELVRQSSEPDTFHFCAAAALAHLGDQGILAHLRASRPAFLDKHVNIEGYLVYYIWQIETQHPPANVLAFIRSAPEPGIERRLWAVRRAVELGLTKADIRNAIFAYATQVQPDRHGIRSGLASLKELGIELGVLTLEDLQSVRIPDVHPTP